MDKIIYRWSEPTKIRLYLLQQYGGFRNLFLFNIKAEGPITFLVLCAAWVWGLLQGAHVMPFAWALLMLCGFVIVISLFQSALFAFISSIYLTKTHLIVGARKWRNSSIIGFSWERQVIYGKEYDILSFSVTKAQVIKITAPPNRTPVDVEQMLTCAGISGHRMGKA